MATLNDLRTKGSVIVTIVIAIALLAFLIGDFMGGGGGSSSQTVGKIENKKIDYTEYANETEYLKEIYSALWGTTSFDQQQYDMIYNEAWNDMVMKYAYDSSFERMGMIVSPEEQVDMVKGQYVSPIITSFFANPTTGAFDAEMLKGFLSNADQDPTVYMLWNYIKSRMSDQRLMGDYTTLVSSAFFANDLEISEAVFASNNSSSIKLVSKPYSSIPDSLVEDRVTSEDVNRYYDKHKEMFRQPVSREVEYVVFDVFPSAEDYDVAKVEVNKLAAEFAATDAPMQFASANSMNRPNPAYFSKDDLNANFAEISFGKKKGEVYGPILSGDIYTMSRLVEIKRMPDSLEARHILLPFTEKERADSLIHALKIGADFAVFAMQYSQDQGSAQLGGELGRFAPEQMVPEFSDACILAKKGDVFMVESQFGIHVVELTYKSRMVRKAQIATITYNVNPSDATLQNIANDANAFIAIADNSLEGFTKAVADMGLSKRNAHIFSTARAINGLDDGRQLIRWAYNNKIDAVSSILEIDGDYVVAILTDIQKKGYAPVEDKKIEITRTLINEAKVDWVAEQVASAQTVEEAAEILDVEVQSMETIYGNAIVVEGIGPETGLIGAISDAEVGVVSKTIKGGFGVYVFEVTGKATAENVTAADEKVRLDSQPLFYIAQRLDQALKEIADITDERVKFF